MTSTPSAERSSPIRVHLVCWGRFHNFDYAPLQLLGLLGRDERIRTTVSGDYCDLDRIRSAREPVA